MRDREGERERERKREIEEEKERKIRQTNEEWFATPENASFNVVILGEA